MSKRSQQSDRASRGRPDDADMIFSFDEQEADDGDTTFTSLAVFETRARNPRRITFDASFEASEASELSELSWQRPPNPVARLLRSRDDDSDDSDKDELSELSEFSPQLLRSFSAPPPRHSGGLTPPPAIDALFSCGGLEPIGSSDRRKRKSMDDAAVGSATGRIRPRAKRAKSFSYASTPLKNELSATASATTTETTGGRSDSISIPRAVAARGRGRTGDATLSGHSHASSSSPSWNATASSLEYFCRRSLDVSSPLRLRFRDLMVGSVARAASYTGP